MKTGNCGTCGKWDSSLAAGMCRECVDKYDQDPEELEAMERDDEQGGDHVATK